MPNILVLKYLKFINILSSLLVPFPLIFAFILQETNDVKRKIILACPEVVFSFSEGIEGRILAER